MDFVNCVIWTKNSGIFFVWWSHIVVMLKGRLGSASADLGQAFLARFRSGLALGQIGPDIKIVCYTFF